MHSPPSNPGLAPSHGLVSPSPRSRRRHAVVRRRPFEVDGAGFVPRIVHTTEELASWLDLRRKLSSLHQDKACRKILDLQGHLALSSDRIPQLAEVNAKLVEATGFRLQPSLRHPARESFMQGLRNRRHACSLRLRPGASSGFVPGSDLIGTYLGHAPALAHPEIAKCSQLFGLAFEVGNPCERLRLEKVYRHCMGFGVVEEDGVVKAFGAGLLSSRSALIGFDRNSEWLDWDVDRMARTDGSESSDQQQYFVAPSLERMIRDVHVWVRRGFWRSR
ncbi:MAG: hypothetical protein QF412_07915 [Planctomycetota bacterium]|nr:hypothetical protein [Planctomycetota bacterium]